MNEKIYRIEESTDYHGTWYRFCSLYNGTRGTWATKENAIKEGELHQKIVLASIEGLWRRYTAEEQQILDILNKAKQILEKINATNQAT